MDIDLFAPKQLQVRFRVAQKMIPPTWWGGSQEQYIQHYQDSAARSAPVGTLVGRDPISQMLRKSDF